MESGQSTCLAHSGMATKINILLILSSIATLLMGAAFPLLVSISAEVAKNTSNIAHNERQVDDIALRVRSLERNIKLM